MDWRAWLPDMWLFVDGQPPKSVICRPDDGLGSKLQVPHGVYCVCVSILRATGCASNPPRRKRVLLVLPGRQREFNRYGTFTPDICDDVFLFSTTKSTFETGIPNYDCGYKFAVG